MRTLDQYLPTMKEGNGRTYFPAKTAIGTGVAVVLLVGALIWAATYPSRQATEARQQLAAYNQLNAAAVQAAKASLAKVEQLVASKDAPKWLQKAAAKQTAELTAELAKVQTVTVKDVLNAAVKQNNNYRKAQKLIAASPFHGLKPMEVPQSPAGQAYLHALEATPPARFEYQQLSDGAALALTAYKTALGAQVAAERWLHRVDVQVNGKKAAQLGAVAVAAGAPVTVHIPADTQANHAGGSVSALAAMLSKARRAEKAAAKPDTTATLAVEPTKNTVASTSSPLAAAQAKAAAEKARQEAAEREAAAQAQAEAERKARAAKYAKLQAQRKAEREARMKAYQAKQAAIAKAEAERKAKAEAAEKKRRAIAAEKAKEKKCTSSLFSRISCAAHGRNLLTGKDGDKEHNQ